MPSHAITLFRFVALWTSGPSLTPFRDGPPYPCRRVAEGIPIAIEIRVVACMEQRESRVARCEVNGKFGQLLPSWRPIPCRFPYFAIRLDEEPVRLFPWKFNRNTRRQQNVAAWELHPEWDE